MSWPFLAKLFILDKTYLNWKTYIIVKIHKNLQKFANYGTAFSLFLLQFLLFFIIQFCSIFCNAKYYIN